MGFILNFDATNAPQADVLEALPTAWYNAAITASELKPTKDGNGQYAEFEFTIMDGHYQRRKVYLRLNIKNASAVAQEIAWKQMSSLCHAIGVLQVADVSVLHNRPLKIRVKYRPEKGEYDATNDVIGFKNINEQTEAAPAPAAPWAPPAAQAPAQQVAPSPVPAQTVWQPPAAQQPWAGQPPQQFAQAPQQQYAAPTQEAAPPAAAPATWMANPQAAQGAQGAAPPWAK